MPFQKAAGTSLGPPHVLVVVVEAAGVGPVIFPDGVAVRVALVEVRGFLGHPHIVRGRLVGHPVQDDLEAQLVGRGEEVFEILHRPEFRIHFLVVGDGIVGAEGALAALGADLVHRHEPEDVHPEVLQAGQLGLDAGEGPLRGELADIHLVHHGAIGPFGMGGRRLLAAGEGQQGGAENQELFHTCVLLIGLKVRKNRETRRPGARISR